MDDLKKAYRVTVVVGLAMMGSLVVYLLLTAVLDQPAALPEGQGDQLFYLFIGSSAVIFFVIPAVNTRMLDPGKERGGPAAAGGVPRIQKLQNAAVVTFALCEVPAILGLVLYFLGRTATDAYLFLVISLFLFTTYFPKFSKWEEWYREHGQGTRKT
jgi:hypothetical protein